LFFDKILPNFPFLLSCLSSYILGFGYLDCVPFHWPIGILF